jgi:hypothetical protein
VSVTSEPGASRAGRAVSADISAGVEYNVGRQTKETCPICNECRLVTVTFVFGAKLPAGGRCPGTAAELAQLCRRPEPVLCYEVEVCPECAWHHLMRKYPAGGPKGRKRREVVR